MKTHLLRTIFSLLILCTVGSVGFAQYSQFQVFPAPQPYPDFGIAFGSKVAIHDDQMIVADPNRPINDGSVSIWEKATNGSGYWTRTFSTLVTGPYNNYPEGEITSVAIEGDWAALGQSRMRRDNRYEQGVVVIFYRDTNGWRYHSYHDAPSIGYGLRFGESLSFSGDRLAIGSIEKGAFSVLQDQDHGSVYIYKYNATQDKWLMESQLRASDGVNGDYFGADVDMSNDLIIVGAPKHHIGGFNDSGQAYIYRRVGTSWVNERTIRATSLSNDDQFGYHVSISNNFAVVGVPNKYGAGIAYIYKRFSGDTWLYHQRFGSTKADIKDGRPDSFGNAVAISGSKLVIADQNYDNKVGRVYLYTSINGSWSLERTFSPSTGNTPNTYFGRDVAICNGQIAVGSPGQHFAGVGYIFEEAASACKNCQRVANSIEAAELGVYPNPTTGIFTLKLPKTEGNYQIKIFDTTGKGVWQKTSPEQQHNIDLSTLKQGIYFIKINAGEKSWTKKVVIQ